jgi:transposase
MVLARQSTRLKNRLLATLAKYAISIEESQDVLSQRDRLALERFLPLLAEHTRFAVEQLLDEVDRVQEKLQRLENRILERHLGYTLREGKSAMEGFLMM